MKRKILVVGNWKMYKGKDEALEFIYNVNSKIPSYKEVETIICPQLTLLDSLVQISGYNLKICAQNMFYKTEGSFTGEVSPHNLKTIGVKYVLLGHKERRMLFNETDSIINLKVVSALKEGLIPIVCIGEYLKTDNIKQIELFLETQLKQCLKDISLHNASNIIIAYEPYWSVGTDIIPKNIDVIIQFIRNKISQIFSFQIADYIRIIYGGSVNSSNIEHILKQKEVDGVLVGRFSLNVDDFLFLTHIAQNITSKNEDF